MKILVLANFGMGLYKFRKELLEELIKQYNEVFVSLPNDEYVPKLEALGCKCVQTQLERRGKNPITDLKLLFFYLKMIRRIKPDVVLTYTIKPNVYGGMACRITKTPYIANITGLGTSIENEGIIRKITLILYKLGLKNASCVFFQNEFNRKFFEQKRMEGVRAKIIPGSGVNLKDHPFEDYPFDDNEIRFLFIGRIMKAKGIGELLQAAKMIKMKFPNVRFDLVGGSEENYSEQLAEMEEAGIIKYHGLLDDVHSFIKKSHATVLPSYHEGMANVLLESASSGRPVLASRVTGCIETFDDGISGLGFEVRNADDLHKTLLKFIDMPYKEKKNMGIAGRRKMEREYDRNIVLNAYLEEISKIMGR